MKKYLVLYLSSVPAKEQMAKSTPEQAKAHPHHHAPGASIEVHEYQSIPGM